MDDTDQHTVTMDGKLWTLAALACVNRAESCRGDGDGTDEGAELYEEAAEAIKQQAGPLDPYILEMAHLLNPE